ncbi:reverse transcriptase domain-containing protein [Tanacetum coccineum]|uniref:Reverse transcriptase domain-containing protein n=1 Tax=Tanacetum coccineum TaxID=301880 RepID=A0ABQ5H0Q3_9ASTR
MNIVLNSSVNICDSEKKNENYVDTCNKCLELEAELVKKNDVYIELSKRFSNLEQHCISLKVSKQLITRKGHCHQKTKVANPAKVKKDIDKIGTINIELEHSVAKLLSGNEKLHKDRKHLKKTYKELYDSIKPSRVHAKEQCDSLIVNLNSKSMENADLKTQIQEKLNLEPLALKVLKNKDAHLEYIKHSREHVDILQEIVESTRALSPLDSNLDSALIMECLVKISKKARILELKRRNIKINVLTTNTPYPLRKKWRIRACTSQKTTKETRSIHRAASGLRPYHFTYPKRRLTMEEMLYKFIDEGKQEHEEMRTFIWQPIWRINSVNTPYPVAQEIAEPNKVESEHLYSDSANEIDEKEPKLKILPHDFEYVYLHGDKSFLIIISSELSEKRKCYFCSPSYCTHKILMEDDYKSIIQPQRRLNPKVQDVVKNEIVKLLDSGLIYPISDSSWVSLIQVVPKKGGITVVLNDNNELIPSRTVTGWVLPNSNRTQRSRKDNIHLSLWDFCLLNNVVWIMQRTSYFPKMHDNNFPRHGGRLYGRHKISGARIEVDRAKIDVIAMFPYPTNVKGVRSFLGHARFYQRFIKDFSMISKPMTQLLMKDAKFDFSDDCKKAFNILKEKLTTAPIIISPDWNVPFELMCDASDFAVGAILGQRIDGKFKPIYYASKTLNNAQEHYTTTKKELLVVVFSFDKFRPYLILSKTVVYTDHSALKYLFSKQDAKPRLIRLENPDLGAFMEEEIADEFPDKHLMILKTELNDDEPCIFKDAKDYVIRCDACQRSGNISLRSKMPQNNIQIGFWKSLSLACGDQTQSVWALKQCNMNLTATTKNHFMELNELMELRDGAYENTRIYKERTKRWHDSRLRGDKNFKVGDNVLLFNSRFKMHPGKLKSRWYGPNVVKTVYPYGTVEITDKNGIRFKVNGQRLKKYHDGHIDAEDKEVVEFEEDTT